MAYDDRPRRYEGRMQYRPPPARAPPRRQPQPVSRGRPHSPPPRPRTHPYPARPYDRRRARTEAIELPPTIWDRISDPAFIGRYVPVVGIATMVVSMAFLGMFYFDVDIEALMMAVFAIGALGTLSTAGGSGYAMWKGSDEDVNRAYLGMGLAIASFIMLGAGYILFWS